MYNILHGPYSLGSWVRGGPYSLREYGPPDRKLGRTVYPMPPAARAIANSLTVATTIHNRIKLALIGFWVSTTSPTLSLYMLRAKRGFAQTRDSPAQTLDPWFVCAISRLPLYFNPINWRINYNEGTKVVSSTPEPSWQSRSRLADKLR